MLYGLAVITLTAPDQVDRPCASWRTDANGREVTQPLLLGSDDRRQHGFVLMRPDRSEYKIGETPTSISTSTATPRPPISTSSRGGRPLAWSPARGGRRGAGGAAHRRQPAGHARTQRLRGWRRRRDRPRPPATAGQPSPRRDRRDGWTPRLPPRRHRHARHPGAARRRCRCPASWGWPSWTSRSSPCRNRRRALPAPTSCSNRELLEPRYEIHDFVELEDDVYSPYDNLPDSIRYGAPARRNWR
jgi:hypothetical protein